MSLRHLDAVFAPRSIAIVGPSEREGSVGRAVVENLFAAGFAGPILPVHPRLRELHGVPVHRDVASLPQVPDLAVIATPAAAVPGLVSELGARGARGAVVLSAGFREQGGEGVARERALLEAARPYGLRIVGPNCLGLLVPGRGINASFTHLTPRPGDLAFLSQSGAMVAAMLDWAADRAVGFSRVVSLGNMSDVDIGDLLDDLALDPDTRAVLLYVEAIASARKTMSAARVAARRKPVIVIKAGTAVEGALAAGSHTGAVAGSDEVYDAAFRRAGMLRVRSIGELFDTAAALALTRTPAGDRLAIVTNGGGPGVLATDSVVAGGGRVAALRPETLARLDSVLGPAPARRSPIDLEAEARGELYAAALRALVADRGSDAVLVLHAPSALSSSLEAAKAVAEAAREPRIPVLASFLGGERVEPARRWLAEHGVPAYPTPEAATRTFLHLVEYRRSRAELAETPRAIADEVSCCDRESAAGAVAAALAAGREWLDRGQLATLLDAYGIALDDADGDPGRDPTALRLAAGLLDDPTFGPVIFLRPQGEPARELALPPLNRALARHLVERLPTLRSQGEGEERPEVVTLETLLVRLAQMAIDHGALVGLELDPLVVTAAGATAAAARARVRAGMPRGADRLAIRPYPVELEGEIALRDGRRLPVRPIRPEDEPRLQEAFEHLTPEDVRLRFFSPLRTLHHDLAAQLTQIDYDRAMAFVVLAPPGDPDGAIVAVARLTADPDDRGAEYAVTVRSDWQGRGLGRTLMRKIIDYARAIGIRELFGFVLRENETMLGLCRELGFTVTGSREGPEILRVSLRLRPGAAVGDGGARAPDLQSRPA